MNQQQAKETNSDCTRIPYQRTGFYSKTIIDYLDKKETLRPFYEHEVSVDGIKAAIRQRQGFPQQRDVLVTVLKQQYQNLSIHEKVKQNIELLSHPNTFTITTAHQPVIFTGPLYFAYKILHTVKLAAYLSGQFGEYNFVPVFYMGSEDADLEELGTINVDGKEYKWNTKQTGAVGRMKVDADFLNLLQQLANQVSVLEYGNELISLFKRCYRLGISIQQATLEVINELFGMYGVIVLIPDHPDLKRLLATVFSKEIEDRFSHQQVEQTLADLSKHYKVQAGGRDLNLFYLLDNSRERIEAQGNDFIVQNKRLHFTKDELLQELTDHPERFSPNVILRGILQETVLPNIVFIGGGGELAYWLELKNVFASVAVPYPVLLLRNSFLFLTAKQKQKIQELGFDTTDVFKDALTLTNELVQQTSSHQINIDKEINEVKTLFERLQSLSEKADVTLGEHTVALYSLVEKKLNALQKKILRAERRKHETEQKQIEALKQKLFPNGNLQERVDNISGWYARYGKQFIDAIYDYSLAIEQEFSIITL